MGAFFSLLHPPNSVPLSPCEASWTCLPNALWQISAGFSSSPSIPSTRELCSPAGENLNVTQQNGLCPDTWAVKPPVFLHPDLSQSPTGATKPCWLYGQWNISTWFILVPCPNLLFFMYSLSQGMAPPSFWLPNLGTRESASTSALILPHNWCITNSSWRPLISAHSSLSLKYLVCSGFHSF